MTNRFRPNNARILKHNLANSIIVNIKGETNRLRQKNENVKMLSLCPDWHTKWKIIHSVYICVCVYLFSSLLSTQSAHIGLPYSHHLYGARYFNKYTYSNAELISVLLIRFPFCHRPEWILMCMDDGYRKGRLHISSGLVVVDELNLPDKTAATNVEIGWWKIERPIQWLWWEILVPVAVLPKFVLLSICFRVSTDPALFLEMGPPIFSW